MQINKKWYYHIFVIYQFVLCAVAISQRIEQQRLERIKQEIAQYKNKIVNLERQEESELDVLENVERQIDLTKKLVSGLKKEEEINRKNAMAAQESLNTSAEEVNRLKQLYARRLVYFYKYGHRKNLEILLSARSINQAYLWLKYQKILIENDIHNLRNIEKKRQVIIDQKDKLDKLYVDQIRILNEKQKESDELINARKKRKKFLEQIQRDKRLLLQQLKDYEMSVREIQRLISEEESRRFSNYEEMKIPQDSDFPELKGKMIWPVRGRIIKGFGNYKHPKLKTITQSLGIDIQSDYAVPVNAVCNGIVSQITWMRGLGNLIMLNHYGGYYTVYAHLGDILVADGERVQAGQVIGNIGETGAVDVPILHFEIWADNKAVDPQKWLR